MKHPVIMYTPIYTIYGVNAQQCQKYYKYAVKMNNVTYTLETQPFEVLIDTSRWSYLELDKDSILKEKDGGYSNTPKTCVP
jgi:hypothetical protein